MVESKISVQIRLKLNKNRDRVLHRKLCPAFSPPRPCKLSLDKKMSVKWHGCRSAPRIIRGGGPQDATLGLLEYISQSNKSADCVDVKDRFKFVDDLTILEIVNLLTIGITSMNMKQTVPSDLPSHNQFIPAQNLQSKKNWIKLINGQKIKR